MTKSSGENHGFVGFALRYGVRSLWRNKRRTMITIGTVALSVTVTLVGMSYAAAVLAMWQQGSIDHGTAHAQLHKSGYWDQPESLSEDLTLVYGNEMEKRLRVDPSIDVMSRRLKFEGIISAYGKTIYFVGMGTEPDTELQVSPGLFDKKADTGTFVSVERPSGVVIGRGLADALGVKLGDEAVLMVNTVHGGVNAVDVVIVGTSDLPLPSLSKRLLYMPLDKAREALELGNRYSELAIRLKPTVSPEQWVEMKQAMVAKYEGDLQGWWQIDPLIKDVERLTDSLIGVICFLLFVSAGISVLNIVFMLVAERTIEIGTLMALGAKTRDIQTLFTLEASIIGAFGGGVGVFIGNSAILAMQVRGVFFANPFGSGTLTIHPAIDPILTIAVFISAISICFVAALGPARKAARVEPVVAFRGQMT